MELFQQNYDMEAYQATLFAEAGINETEILEETNMQEEGMPSLLSLRERFRTFAAAAANQTALMQAIRNRPQQIQAMQGILQKCTATPLGRTNKYKYKYKYKYNKQQTTNNKQQTTNKQSGEIQYKGFHLEAGLALDGSFTQMIYSGGQWGRVCLGGLHLGAQVSCVCGCVYTLDAFLVPCVYWLAAIDIPVGFFPYSLSVV
ncbi:hypothetical protein SEMRO_2690_G334740.1 [Seminavis robusta]|uniref:Uncharacterized protein n=1 Tax=Seminavis robusta TaxID=568900 RepID=A0A9N8F0Y2_9STRA|nr:hypothetical protein SEMRO_2690_G334740.1 [Seminavis robusta]|eukprot:Sro2690_g334740.1 n/a (202) ;mRNA; r:10407-11012